MIRQTIRLWKPEEYHYPSSFGFVPKLDGYLHEDFPRPCIIIVPGGGYRRCAPREGAAVALRFFGMGYQAFVCTYTTNPLGHHPLMKQCAEDLAAAVRHIRQHAQELMVNSSQIVVCGFSAGAHLAGTLGVHWSDFLRPGSPSCRPDAMLLCYPVISICSDIAHMGSQRMLLGGEPDDTMSNYMRLERQVHPDCPPVFLWHTATDETVSVENSRVFAKACAAAGVKHELHIFPSGPHGLSLADGSRVNAGDSLYTLEQTACMMRAIESGRVSMNPEEISVCENYPEVKLLRKAATASVDCADNEEVKKWVVLAYRWLETLWHDSN